MTTSSHTTISKSDFQSGLKTQLANIIDDPEDTCGEFLGYCEPIIFGDFSLFDGVSKLPHPFDKYMYVYQAWGLISSDGFECYLEETDSNFDANVDCGLKLLGCHKPQGVLRRARFLLRLFGSRTGMLPTFIERHCWKQFYDPLEEFERDYLGPKLRETLQDQT
jgi:hypothetical protein